MQDKQTNKLQKKGTKFISMPLSKTDTSYIFFFHPLRLFIPLFLIFNLINLLLLLLFHYLNLNPFSFLLDFLYPHFFLFSVFLLLDNFFPHFILFSSSLFNYIFPPSTFSLLYSHYILGIVMYYHHDLRPPGLTSPICSIFASLTPADGHDSCGVEELLMEL